MLAALIVAAGSSQRMGFDKTFALLAGKPVLAHSISAFENCAVVEEIVVVGRADRLREVQEIVQTSGFRKVRSVIAGGAQRQESVRLGLAAVSLGFVAVHDAARPLVTPECIERVYQHAQVMGAAAAAAPVIDTLKQADEEMMVRGGVKRDGLFAMQTPQIFARDLLVRAYEAVFAARLAITDEVSALEHLGHEVRLVPNDEWNFKITFPADLQLAELILASRR